jgi:parallel beta-helix repeat protein
LENCAVSHVGGYAIDFGRGCKDNRIVRCEVTDIGAGGIRIGETSLRKDEADKTTGNEVTDCHIHDLGICFPAGVAIWVGHSSKNTFAHNHIHDTYYSGFSIGWSWGYGPSGAQENVIEYNDVHHIGRGMLADMGGIYTLGTCTGTVIRNNVFHDVWSSTYGGWAIYFDEGSTGVVAENNVAYRCKSNGFHQHYGKNNTLRNNIFALSQEAQIARTRKEDHFTLTFERNIVYWKEGKLLSGNWEGNQFRWEKNLFWNPAGTKGLPEKWKEQGLDKDSVIADPMFADPDKGDFTLKPDSPALKLGFQPIDVSRVGPRP